VQTDGVGGLHVGQVQDHGRVPEPAEPLDGAPEQVGARGVRCPLTRTRPVWPSTTSVSEGPGSGCGER
jgi:hypothetical protein